MIHFPPLLTKRLNVQLRELGMRESIDLAAMPLNSYEQGTSALLARAVEVASGPNADPARWTVQERMLVVSHYLAGVNGAGANFSIGDGLLMDYLDAERDTAPESVSAGKIDGAEWTVHQLHGAEAEGLERICRSSLDWLVGDMAARMREEGSEGPPDAATDPAAYAEWLTSRKAVFEAMPESDFAEVLVRYRHGLAGLHHLFELEFDDHGHLALPKEVEAGPELAPARFPVSAAVSRLAHDLCTRLHRPGL